MIGPLGENLIFVISPPRAGSTLLQRLLIGSPDVFATAEPWIMLHPLYALRAGGHTADYNSEWARAALNDFCEQLDGGTDAYVEAVRGMGIHLYNHALKPSGRRCFLDKTPRYYFIVPELLRTFPEAKFVFLLRNPFSVLASILDTWIKDDWSRLKDYACDLCSAPKLLAQALTEFGDRAITVHYEKLVASPEMVLPDLCQRLQIAYDPQMPEYRDRLAPRGRMGDTIGIHRYSMPVTERCEQWKTTLATPRARLFSEQYLDVLADETLAQLGYPKKRLLAELTALPEGEIAPDWVAYAEDFFRKIRNEAPVPIAPAPDLNALSPAAEGCAHQAELFIASGELKQARDYLERALDLAPAHPRLLELQEILTQAA